MALIKNQLLFILIFKSLFLNDAYLMRRNLTNQMISEILSNLAHEFSREHFRIFHFFMCLVLILLF